ncbi:uncharacterized protein LOC129311854 [Prosopis cineraria]|uniref:uncharacterized protein LOC129311854 n=1 Tax=Prosopis cineraria TaxID=364024 RepID=UPI00240F57DE|nr:uncharacterized protein LOC129311854 [Prosopis cineraria]
MVGQRAATKPSRSDEVLDANEQERIANQIREQFDSLAPKRPVKPNRSEPDPDAQLDLSSTVLSHSIPELLKFQSFQSQPHAVFSDEAPKDVPDEFVETQYYKELTSIDKQHHTTGSGFIRVESLGGDDLKLQKTQIINVGETKLADYKSNPATNDWIPDIDENQVFVSVKPNRSESS